MLDQAPCGPAVPCLSRQARAAVMVRLRGEADAGHRSAVSGHRSPVKRVIGRQCHSGVSVIRVNTGMVNFRKFLLPNKAVIFLKIFREIYICPKDDSLGRRRNAALAFDETNFDDSVLDMERVVVLSLVLFDPAFAGRMDERAL